MPSYHTRLLEHSTVMLAIADIKVKDSLVKTEGKTSPHLRPISVPRDLLICFPKEFLSVVMCHYLHKLTVQYL